MHQQHKSFSFLARLLSIVSFAFLFLVIVVTSPSRAFAGSECFDTTSVANSGGITINSIEGIQDTMHSTTGVISIKVYATLKDPGAMAFWTSTDRDYTLVAAQIEASGFISPDGVESTATRISQNGSTDIIITFNPDAAGFTQLDNDQRTNYDLSLQAHKYVGSTSCRLTTYVVNRADDAPPPILCGDPNTIGKCEASGGCGKNETCAQLMGGFQCQKIFNSCGYQLSCGSLADPSKGDTCNCSAPFMQMTGTTNYCCGWQVNGRCQATAPPAANPPANPAPADSAADSSEPPGETSPSETGSLLDAIKGPTNKTFDALNPLNIAAGLKGESSKSPYLRAFSTPGGVVSRLLLFAFPIAGIILFLMIVWGGFEMVTGAANAKSMDAGKQRITAGVIGFILLFVSYWLMQLIELIFGLSIL